MGHSSRVPAKVRGHRGWRDYLPRIAHDVLFGIIIGGILMLGKVWFEGTRLGELTEQASYQFLQSCLGGGLSTGDIPATVVDISGVEAVATTNGADKGVYKPRQFLKQLLTAIAEKEPIAIGVDLEFSPRTDFTFETAGDPDFFAECQKIANDHHTKIFLGVQRGAAALNPAGWLGLADYKDLAANVEIPRKRDTPELVRWSQPKANPEPDKLASLSAALADAYREHEGAVEKQPGWLSVFGWMVENELQGGKDAFDAREYSVDYSFLQKLRDGNIPAVSAANIAGQDSKLNGRIVLIGNADFENLPPDSFVAPGQDQPIPGVYVHAAGACTLIEGPLYRVTEHGRIALDVLFALLVILSVAAIRISFERSGEEVVESRLQFIMTALAVFAVIVAGALIVHWTRILWTDFLLVAVTLWIHPSLERGIPELVRGLKGASRSAVTVTGKEEE
jgi:CHASE2 domain-containing sensor protein